MLSNDGLSEPVKCIVTYTRALPLVCTKCWSKYLFGHLLIALKEFNIFFHLKATEFIHLLLLINKSDIWYQIFCVIYHTHIAQVTIEALLYQRLRFIIITFTYERHVIILGDY